MPQCKRCPIVKECNKTKLTAKAPGKKGKDSTVRLCPFLALLGSLARTRNEQALQKLA